VSEDLSTAPIGACNQLQNPELRDTHDPADLCDHRKFGDADVVATSQA
jgi:hypothetical protein